jgi:hypothetical protein
MMVMLVKMPWLRLHSSLQQNLGKEATPNHLHIESHQWRS